MREYAVPVKEQAADVVDRAIGCCPRMALKDGLPNSNVQSHMGLSN
jgi:hypothetical protein